MITQIIKKITQIRKETKEIVGIDIAENQITVVVLKTAPTYAVGKVADFVVKKMSPVPTDEEICTIIEEIFRVKHLFKKEVWLNLDLPSQNINFARLALPIMPQPEIPNAIKWNLKDKVSLDIKNSQFAYELINESIKEDGSKNLNIMAVLVNNDSIDRFLSIFKGIGIELSGINVTPFSLSNVLKTDKDLVEKKEPILVCYIGIEYTYLSIYVEGKLAFVRQIPLALQSFINAMTGTFVSDKGRVELNSIDAKKIIEEFGIPKEMDVILDGKITPTQIIAMVRPVIERFISEVTRSIDYYQREFNARVEKILMTGEGSNIKGLNDFISKNLNLNVDYLKLREGLLCGASLGAALGYKGAINLLPEELKQKKEVQVKKTALRVSTVAVLGILFFSFLTISIQIKSYKEQLDLVRNQKAILKDLKDIQDRIDQRSAVISSIRESETPVDLVLKELSNITPGNIAFLEVSLNQKEKSLKLRGRVSAKPEVVQGILSDFMEMLEKSIFIKEANLSNVQKETAGAGELSIFEINCVLE